MNLYVKVFLGTGLPFGILMGLLYSQKYGCLEGGIRGILAGVSFGLIGSLLLVPLNNLFVRRTAFKNSSNEKIDNAKRIRVRLSYSEVFNRCVNALNSIKSCRILKKSQKEGALDAKIGASWKSWGELVSIRLRESSNGIIDVEISSKSAVRTTILDYGKNLDNIEKIARIIRED